MGAFPEDLLGASSRARLGEWARAARPYVARLDRAFARRLARRFDPLQRRALLAIAPGATARLLAAGKPLAELNEQIGYQGRRLARLNVPAPRVLEALREYDRDLQELLAKRFPGQAAAFQEAGDQLRLASAISLNQAFYQVRESETQTFYGLYRAELEARGLDDLLRRFVVILTRAFRAASGRLFLIDAHAPLGPSRLLRRLSRPRYLAPADGDLILDPLLRGQYASYWSVPVFENGALAGILQLAFPAAYRWLPRELDLLQAVMERALAALERTRLLRELQQRESQLRQLAAGIMQAEEGERRRIARELHDETGQTLLALRLQLEMMGRNAPAGLRPRLAEARRSVEELIRELRRIVAAVSPSVLDRLGLEAALRHLARRFGDRGGARLSVRIPRHLPRPAPEIETALYRTAQECLHNAARHARAGTVNLCLRATDTSLELIVRDDGTGFEVASALARPGSLGLEGLRQRAMLLGGEMRIQSRPGHGTEVRVQLPLQARRPEDAGSGASRSHGQNSHLAHG